ncbi:uncharacterized protein VTP21DRAFT_5916 [Calcarisporiella thermophila]|uniref:uncharacterized protein n=1 Tax=Calcarisporiella thermophila TaxID=911321 RepID=UPI0037427DDF
MKQVDFQSESLRLAGIQADCLTLGCLRGFKHFEVFLRGREELILRVNKTERSTNRLSIYMMQKRVYSGLTSLGIARARLDGAISEKTRKMIQNSIGEDTVVPVSPLDQDLKNDTTKTNFLIAAYARYRRPYVWLRSNQDQQRLHSSTSSIDTEEDCPLELDTVINWKTKDIKLWDIVAELLKLTLSPPPINPFTVDHTFFDNLPLEEAVVATGSMINFLSTLYLQQYSFSDKIFDDLRLLHARHYTLLDELQSFLEVHHRQKMAKETHGIGGN